VRVQTCREMSTIEYGRLGGCGGLVNLGGGPCHPLMFRFARRQLSTKALPPFILYDIPGTVTKHQSWSPNVWKTRCVAVITTHTDDSISFWDDTCNRIVLNYKGIPHQTEWVEFPDITKVAKQIGAPHTFLRRSGEPLYTVPILRDPTTDQCLAGSLQIALNLDRLYPHSRKLFPPGTEDQIADFGNKFYRSVAIALGPLLLSRTWAQLRDDGGSKDYFRTTRERMFRGSLESFSVPGLATDARWIAVREALEPFAKDADVRATGASDTFLLGERETYADVVAVSWLSWARRMWGADTREWTELERWHDGRWGRLVRAFKKWEYFYTPSAPDSAKCVFPLFELTFFAEKKR
jgi:glutathione S-transferase